MTLKNGESKRYEEILREKSIVGGRLFNEEIKQKSRNRQIEIARAIDHTSIVQKPRQYQLEAFYEARKRNIIMCADTGAGKTLTAILLIQSFHQENEAPDAMGPHSQHSSHKQHVVKRSVFLAPTVELVHQQSSRVAAITGLTCDAFVGVGLDNWTDEQWKSSLENVDCMAFTPQAFVNLIFRGKNVFDTASVGLVIFDEAHHAQKNHPYVRVINTFEQSRLISGRNTDVRVFGMTASPTKECFSNLRCKPHVCDVDSEEVQNASAVPPTKVQLYFLDHSDCKAEVKGCLMRLMGLLFSVPAYCEGENHLLNYPAVATEEGKAQTLSFPKTLSYLPTINYNKYIERPLQDAFDSLGTWPALVLARLIVRDQRKALWNISSDRMKWQAVDARFDAAQHLIHSSISWATPNLRRLCSAKVGALVGLLRRTIRNYSGKEPFQCMVFVERRPTTRVLSLVLGNIFASETDEAMRLLNVNYIVGGETRSSSSVLDRFRKGNIQVLVTTAVCCEGIDIPAVSCVVCMDNIPNSRSLMHTRGRVRSKGGIMVILCPHGDDEVTTQIAEMLREAELIRRNDLSEEKGFYGKDKPLALKYPKLVYRILSSGAVLDMDVAVPLLSEALSCSGKTPFSPIFMVEVRQFDVDVKQLQYISCTNFSAEVKLPSSINAQLEGFALPPNWESQEFFPRKSEAKAAAAMEACILMHQAGLLDDNLRPVRSVPDVQKCEWWDSSTLKEEVHLTSINIPCCPIMEDLGLCPVRPDSKLLAWHLEGTDGLYFVVDNETTDSDHIDAVSEFLGGHEPQLWPGVSEEELQQMRDQHELLLSSILWSEGSTGGRWSLHGKDTCDYDRGYLLVWKPNGPERSILIAPSEKEDHFRFVFPLMDINGPGIVSYRRFRELGPDKKLQNRIAHIPENLEHRFGPNSSLLQDLLAEHAPLQQRITLMHSSKSYDFTGMEDKPLVPCLLFDLPRAAFGRKCGNKVINFVTLVLQECCELSPISKEHYEAGLKSLPLLLLAERALMSSTLSQKTDINISPSMVHKAVKNPDNEVLEFIGDAWLKLYATLASYSGSTEGMCMQEFTMTLLVHNMVSNMRLVKAAMLEGFDHFVHFPTSPSGNQFDFWRPPGFPPSTYSLKLKNLADIVEAIMGAAFLENGQLGPVPLVQCLGIDYLRYPSFLEAALAGRVLDGKDPVGTKQTADTGLRSKLEHKLEEKLGYKFNDLQLLRDAFTHPSWQMFQPRGSCRDYQRLEFLGDAILEFLVTIGMVEDEMIDMETLGPGLLSQMREHSVSNATLADIAVQLQLHRHLRATPEVNCNVISFTLGTSGKHKPPKTLADLVEALIAAVWIDSRCDFPTLMRVFYYPLLREGMRCSVTDVQLVWNEMNSIDEDTGNASGIGTCDGGFGDELNDTVDVLSPEGVEILYRMLPHGAVSLAEDLKRAMQGQMAEAIAKKTKM